MRAEIKSYRKGNPGWGAISILVEMEEENDYKKSELPSDDSVHRFLKQEGFVRAKEPKGRMSVTECKTPKQLHEQWEMDAEGACQIEGLDYQAIINVKDGLSKKYCITFPVSVKNGNTQPSTPHYKWALRLAFIESGLPQRIQVDNDSVFIENSSKSPFPSRVHLWLLALGVELCFIDRPPPAKNAIIERSHQIMSKQVVEGKKYNSWRKLFDNCNKRRKRLNEKYPSRALGKKAPLQAFPKAAHSGLHYSIEREQELLDFDRIYEFLAEGQWYRKVSSNKGVKLGGQRYFIKKATPKSMLCITFCKKTKMLIFRDVNELNSELDRLPTKGISKEILMEGETKSLHKIYNQFEKAKDFPLV